MSSFSKKRIDVILRLANNPAKPEKSVFNEGKDNTLELTGLRVIADMKKVGTLGQGTKARLKIYGMQQKDMDLLSVMTWDALTVERNTVIVSAGDSQGMSQVFGGQILNAWADYSAAPEVCLVIDAIPGYFDQINPAAPSSYTTEADVATIMKDLATKMGYAFINNGVDKKIKPYLDGTLMKQARSLASHADILLIVDHETLTISNKGSPIKGDIPLITPTTGLIGYPAHHKQGISFNTLYNPAIRFNGLVRLEDTLEIVKGEWVVVGLDYQLESERPDGAWFCHIEAARFNNAITAK